MWKKLIIGLAASGAVLLLNGCLSVPIVNLKTESCPCGARNQQERQVSAEVLALMRQEAELLESLAQVREGGYKAGNMPLNELQQSRLNAALARLAFWRAERGLPEKPGAAEAWIEFLNKQAVAEDLETKYQSGSVTQSELIPVQAAAKHAERKFREQPKAVREIVNFVKAADAWKVAPDMATLRAMFEAETAAGELPEAEK